MKSTTGNDDEMFITMFRRQSQKAFENAKNHGFHDEDRDDRIAIGLMHTELSEAFEAIRHGNPPDNHIPEFSGIESEFADVVIRIMDTSHKRGYRVGEAIVAKMAYNERRPHMHGKNC